MKTAVFIMIAFFVGGLFPIQGAINSHLGKFFNNPLQASFISFTCAIFLLSFLLLCIRPEFPDFDKLFKLKWYYFIGGGVCGVSFVTMFIMLTPEIGIANATTAFIAGELIMSVLLDHFGIFGLEIHEISITRFIGCLFLFAGLLLIQKP